MKLVDEKCDVGNIGGSGAPLDTRVRIDNIGCRTAGNDQGPLVGNGAVKPGIPAPEGKGWDKKFAVLLYNITRYFDYERGRIHPTAMVGINFSGGFVVDQNTCFLQDFQRTIMDLFNFLLS